MSLEHAQCNRYASVRAVLILTKQYVGTAFVQVCPYLCEGACCPDEQDVEFFV